MDRARLSPSGLASVQANERGDFLQQLHAGIVDHVALAPVAGVPGVEVAAAERGRLLAVVLGIDQRGAEAVIAERRDGPAKWAST
jgi:hypothetical protein